MELPFSYQVTWRASNIQFTHRFEKYLDPNFFQHRIHWFSIFNSFMMVIFLVGLVSMILMRTLRKDYASMVGTGHQLATVALGCILIALVEHLYTERGTLLSTAIFMYAATSPINGYFGGALYSKMGGKAWIKQMVCGAALFPALICGTAFLINFVAIYYHASRAIPILTMLAVAGICLFVILPLNLVGTILGRNISGTPDNPCRVNTVPRPIPEKKWFMEPWAIVMLGGVLPFGSIFIEVYFIFTSFWQYKIYYVFGFMLLVYIIMLVVTVCVTIVCTYFLLNSEDYRWQWTSFCAGGSISVYVYLYSLYYFIFKTKMFGLFQTVFYFSYMALGSIALGLLCVQQKLESGCEDIRESDSFFPELLARFSSQSVRDEVQALITATESFRELLPTTVDCIVSLSDEDISNLFVLFRQIPMPSSAHTFSKPAPSETDSVYCRLLSRIGFTNWRGHLMYEVQTGFCGLDIITLTIVAILSVSTSSHHNH
ncbi:Transmembrane 9 superfamily member 3 [Geodia barretti]|uniref:Transmembrane 9 superfamily member n=1 Tax=Geodia barretti TaxID=519541 RepID=A0AA35R2X0_GEOBA|nr:Transmembrane 9 superfamily member 3 [Geodia barretti]